MSSRETSEIVLDNEGNVDTDKLSISLRSALDFDIKYKQTDNMKKRACKVAGSYDEFKAMVDCAHLKTVNRQEIDSLRAVKPGWKKGKSTNNGIGISILSGENIPSKKQTSKENTLLTSKKFRQPKTPLEFERDLRRHTSESEKIK